MTRLLLLLTAALTALAPLPPRWTAAPVAQTLVGDPDLERASAARTVTIGSPSAGGRTTTLPLEVYVARVLAGEGEPGAAPAATQALAVAIRTFAAANAGRHRRDGYDLCDTTHCQVLRTATQATRDAAWATAGRVLAYRGVPAEVFYSASCGGVSETAAEVWPGASFPYLRAVADEVHEGDVPWTLERTLDQIRQALAAAGFDGGRLRDVRVLDRNASGRVSRLAVAGLEPAVISGAQFRMAMGPTAIRSAAFSLTRAGRVVRFTGRGYGHGVGMCVIGAGRRARRGEDVGAILAHYYPGLDFEPLDRLAAPGRTDDNGAVVSTAAPAAAAPSAAVSARAALAPGAGAGGIAVRVGAGAGLTASSLEAMVRGARASLSTVLGASVAPVVVELHGTVDSFRIATGRPWWVSAAAAGTRIDLAPPSVLTLRDGLEATLRAALAELIVAPALAGRPAWVRVGAGRYFARARATPAGTASARTAPAGAATSRLRCPSDAELTLAVSATAQRDAEARAEACFARALARTRDWRDVR